MDGPARYTEQHGGYEHMLARHRNLSITAEQRLQFVALLSRAADDADPEFRAAIMGHTIAPARRQEPPKLARPHNSVGKDLLQMES